MAGRTGAKGGDRKLVGRKEKKARGDGGNGGDGGGLGLLKGSLLVSTVSLFVFNVTNVSNVITYFRGELGIVCSIQAMLCFQTPMRAL